MELQEFIGDIKLQATFNCLQGFDTQRENYFYFIARSLDNAEGEALIENVNGKSFLGKVVEARPFVQRSRAVSSLGCGDRRINTEDSGPPVTIEF